ncbi:hypothetical protein D3C83_235390 [compost metagenome]
MLPFWRLYNATAEDINPLDGSQIILRHLLTSVIGETHRAGPEYLDKQALRFRWREGIRQHRTP